MIHIVILICAHRNDCSHFKFFTELTCKVINIITFRFDYKMQLIVILSFEVGGEGGGRLVDGKGRKKAE